MAMFPTEIVADILSRLPVKPLLRFRCVSKPWCALIDSKDFIKMHLDQSIETNSNLSLFLGGTGLYSIDFDSLNNAVELDHPFKNSRFSDVLGSCNGLFLLVGGPFAIWNPSTRKYRKLPSNPVERPNCVVSTENETYGFGYDSINDDYKVIRVVEFRDIHRAWISSEAKIFSLKLNSWRRIGDFPFRLPYKRVWGAHVKGALHTVVNQYGNPDLPEIIVAFNIVAEEYYLVPEPDFSDKSFDMTVEVLEGCLCMLNAYKGYRTDIWVMKDYGVRNLGLNCSRLPHRLLSLMLLCTL